MVATKMTRQKAKLHKVCWFNAKLSDSYMKIITILKYYVCVVHCQCENEWNEILPKEYIYMTRGTKCHCVCPISHEKGLSCLFSLLLFIVIYVFVFLFKRRDLCIGICVSVSFCINSRIICIF